MIDEKDLLKVLKMLFECGRYAEMYSRINNNTGLRESGITIMRAEKERPEVDNYQVSINWEVLEKSLGGK